MSESVIHVSELTRRFGAKTALASVSLSMPRGAVYGLVGANGAGKTTLIKHILGLLRAESGSVRVFGIDPVADPVAVLSRIGYLSEENDLPAWMRVDELIRYSRAFYPAWDDAYAEELRRAFALDGTAKIKSLSRGQKARAGLLIALAHRPELLVLDEPSSGLDPIVRRDILGAILRTIAHEGRTVIAISQSGGSTDLLEALDVLKPRLLIALTNTIDSPLTARADAKIDVGAGREVAVPASKSVTATVAGLKLAKLDVIAARLDQPVMASAEGSFANAPLTLAATLGAPGLLMPGAKPAGPFPVDVSVQIAGASVALKGTMANPDRLSGLDLAVTVGAGVAVLIFLELLKSLYARFGRRQIRRGVG